MTNRLHSPISIWLWENHQLYHEAGFPHGLLSLFVSWLSLTKHTAVLFNCPSHYIVQQISRSHLMPICLPYASPSLLFFLSSIRVFSPARAILSLFFIDFLCNSVERRVNTIQNSLAKMSVIVRSVTPESAEICRGESVGRNILIIHHKINSQLFTVFWTRLLAGMLWITGNRTNMQYNKIKLEMNVEYFESLCSVKHKVEKVEIKMSLIKHTSPCLVLLIVTSLWWGLVVKSVRYSIAGTGLCMWNTIQYLFLDSIQVWNTTALYNVNTIEPQVLYRMIFKIINCVVSSNNICCYFLLLMLFSSSVTLVFCSVFSTTFLWYWSLTSEFPWTETLGCDWKTLPIQRCEFKYSS